MHTNRLRLAVVALLLVGGPASATLKKVEDAYELGLSQVTLPGGDTGQVVVRPCARCKPEILRVSAATVYLVRPASTPVPRSSLVAAAAKAAGRSTATVFVYYEPQTMSVRRVVLDPGR
jgi:hypothetical protein